MNVIVSFALFLINTIFNLIGLSMESVNLQEQVIPKKDKVEWIVYQEEIIEDESRKY